LSIEPDRDGDELDLAKKVPRGLVVASSNSTKLLEFGEEVLDQVPLLINMTVETAALPTVGLRRYHHGLAGSRQGREDALIGVECLVGVSTSACISGNRSSAPTRSCASPPVRKKPSRLPSASTTVWILVLNPARDLPIAWSSPSFLRLHCADERARSCCRSSRNHRRHRRQDTERHASRLRIWPSD